jgi:hypothetical protein
MADVSIMRIPAPVLATAIIVLLLLALVAGSSRVRAEPDLARPDVMKPSAEDCATRLAKTGIAVERAAPPAKPSDAACMIVEPVVLVSVADAALKERRIRFPDHPTLSCAMAERFARFTSDIAAPLALGITGKELIAVSTGPGFECRPRNRQPGAKTSSHGQGNAVDTMAVEVVGGRKLSVEKPDGPETIRFMAAYRAAACGIFSTVLGPGSDAAHANHIHVDIEQRGRDGRSKFCQ